jgi:large conductance mechanosensitive channel
MEEEKIAVKKSFLSGLLEFLREYSVIGMAIGVIIAQTSKDLVDSIVKGIFTPLINLVIPGEGIKNLIFTVKGSTFDVGSILNALLTFFIVMLLLYLIVKRLLKKDDLLAKK